MSLLDGIKQGMSDYFSSSSSPVGKITQDLEQFKASLSDSDAVAKATSSTLAKAVTAVTAPPPGAKIQADGSFIVPTDPAAAQAAPGMAWGLSLAAIALVAVFVLKKG